MQRSDLQKEGKRKSESYNFVVAVLNKCHPGDENYI